MQSLSGGRSSWITHIWLCWGSRSTTPTVTANTFRYDELAAVRPPSAATVCVELIGSRYERRFLLITANQPFGEWGKVFPDQGMTLAAIEGAERT